MRGAARRLHHCRDCRRDTEQSFLYAEARATNENGRHPKIEWFRCTTCGLTLCTMADVPDTEGLVLWIVNERLGRLARGTGSARLTPTSRPGNPKTLVLRGNDRWLDYEDAVGHLRAQILVVFRKWDPGRGVPFAAYATGELRNDLLDWLRVTLGRDRPKPFANAVSLDALRAPDGATDGGADPGDDRGDVDALLGLVTVDGDGDRDPALEWAILRRDRDLARTADRVRGRADAGAAPGARPSHG